METLEIRSAECRQVNFNGRVAAAQNAVFMNWSGCGVSFRFRGTQASAFFTAGAEHDMAPEAGRRAYIGVFLDEHPFAVARFPLDRKTGEYPLVQGLTPGEHTVYVVKQTEVGDGRAALTALATDGEFLPPPEKKPLRIEWIGDSITCGYGNICSTESPEYCTGEENFSMTYAAIAAELLKADLSCIAASGNGFFHDYGCQTHNLIPVLYRHTDLMLDGHLGRRAALWNFDQDPRDLVVIKLGQNDGQFCSGADLPEGERTPQTIKQRRKEFEKIAADFLREITCLRPGTPVLLLYETGMFLQEELLAAAAAVQGVSVMRIAPKMPSEGVGANGHWSVQTHARVGIQLAERIREMLC